MRRSVARPLAGLAAARKRRHTELCSASRGAGASLVLIGDEFAEVLTGGALWLDAALGVPPGRRELQRRAGISLYWRSTVANALRGYVEEPRVTASLAMGGDSSYDVATRLRSCAAFPRPPAPGTAQVFVVVVGSHELAAGLQPRAARRFAAAAQDIVRTILARNPAALVLLQPPLPLPVAPPARARAAAAARYAATAALWALQQPGRVHVLSCAAAATVAGAANATGLAAERDGRSSATAAPYGDDLGGATLDGAAAEAGEIAGEARFDGYYGSDDWGALPTQSPTVPPPRVEVPVLLTSRFADRDACGGGGIGGGARASTSAPAGASALRALRPLRVANNTARDAGPLEPGRERCVLSIEGYAALLRCWGDGMRGALKRRKAHHERRYRVRSGERKVATLRTR